MENMGEPQYFENYLSELYIFEDDSRYLDNIGYSDDGGPDPDDYSCEASFDMAFHEYDADNCRTYEMNQSVFTAIKEGRLKDLKKLIGSSTLSLLMLYDYLNDALSCDQLRAAKLMLHHTSQLVLEPGLNGGKITHLPKFHEHLLAVGVRLRNEKVVKLLLDEGVDVHAKLKDQYGYSYKTGIHIAVQKECSQIVERLLIGGADVNSRYCFNYSSHYEEHTLLHDAVRRGNEPIVKLLLQFGADVDATDNNGLTPLYTAVQKGFLEITKYLIQEGATTNPAIASTSADSITTTEEQYAPLLIAIRNNHREIIQLLLENGANVDARDNGNTVLKLAVETRCPEIVTNVLNYCPDVENNKAALYSAIHSMGTDNDRIILETLLQYGFSLHCEDKNNSDLLFNAVRGNFLDITKLLLKYNADINQIYDADDPYFRFCSSLLHVAVVRGDIDMVKILTDHGANLDARNSDGKTPLVFALALSESKIATLLLKNGAQLFNDELLILAAERTNADVIKIILEKGVEVNKKASFGKELCEMLSFLKTHGEIPPHHAVSVSEEQFETALHIAADIGRYEVVKLLLEHDAEVNNANYQNVTPLFSSAHRGHFKTVQLLLENGANVTIVDRSEQTALHKAAGAGHCEVVKLLIEFGATINAEDENGNTPLYISAEANHWKVVEILLKFGASVKKSMRAQLSTLDIAIQNSNNEIVKLLLQHGAKADESRHFESSLVIFTNKQQPEIVELLLKSGADVNSLDWLGRPVLSVATDVDSEELVKLLLDYGSETYEIEDFIEPFLISAEKGNLKIIERLLNVGASINFADKVGQTALFKAAKQGHIETVQALLKYGALVNCKTSDGETPLSISANKGHLDIVQALLKSNADIDSTDNDGRSPIYEATREDHVEIVRLLLKHGAKTETKTLNGGTPLSVSASRGNLDIFEGLIKSKAVINSTDKEGKSPLYNASKEGHIEIVQQLLKHGAAIDIQTLHGKTPLFISAGRGHLNIVETLLKFNAHSTDKNQKLSCCNAGVEEGHFKTAKRLRLVKHTAGIDIKTIDEETALSVAANKGHLSIVENLLKFGAEINSTDKNKNTPLHNAVANDHTEIVKLLLKNGAATEIKNVNGETPLFIAVGRHNFSTVQILLESEANPNSKDNEGKTPIHRIFLYDNSDILELLLEHGAEIDSRDENGRTAFVNSILQLKERKELETWLKHGASTESIDHEGNKPLHLVAAYLPGKPPDTENIKLLLEYGGNVDAKGAEGETPLFISARWGRLTNCRVLLEAGASINLTDCSERTPLYIAVMKSHNELVKFLLEYDAKIDSKTLSDVKSTLLRSDDEGKLATAETIVRHVVKMRAANLCENTEIIEAVSNSDKIKIDEYQHRCEVEVTKMMSEYIYSTKVTLYEILTKNLEQLTHFAKTDSAVKILKAGDHKIKFPIYADAIEIRIRKGDVRKNLMEQGIKVYNFLIRQYDDLPYELMEEIFSYLSNNDLRMLIHSCKPILSLLSSPSRENLDLFDTSEN